MKDYFGSLYQKTSRPGGLLGLGGLGVQGDVYQPPGGGPPLVKVGGQWTRADTGERPRGGGAWIDPRLLEGQQRLQAETQARMQYGRAGAPMDTTGTRMGIPIVGDPSLYYSATPPQTPVGPVPSVPSGVSYPGTTPVWSPAPSPITTPTLPYPSPKNRWEECKNIQAKGAMIRCTEGMKKSLPSHLAEPTPRGELFESYISAPPEAQQFNVAAGKAGTKAIGKGRDICAYKSRFTAECKYRGGAAEVTRRGCPAENPCCNEVHCTTDMSDWIDVNPMPYPDMGVSFELMQLDAAKAEAPKAPDETILRPIARPEDPADPERISVEPGFLDWIVGQLQQKPKTPEPTPVEPEAPKIPEAPETEFEVEVPAPTPIVVQEHVEPEKPPAPKKPVVAIAAEDKKAWIAPAVLIGVVALKAMVI